MKSFFVTVILTIILLPLSEISVVAEPCGEKCLSQTDLRFMRQTQNAVRTWMTYYSVDMAQQKEQGMSARQILRGFVSISDSTTGKVKDARNNTSNLGLRKFYGRMLSLISELRDLSAVGDSLIAAQSLNNLSLVGSLVETINSSDAKHLGAPVKSYVELQQRISAFQSLLASREKTFDADLKSAVEELKQTEGIDI